MEVDVRNQQRKITVDCERITALAERSLTVLGLPEGQLSVALVGDRKIRELNRRFRLIDKVTDVLSFSQNEGEGIGPHGHLLGDVVIAVSVAQRQADERRQPVETEIDLLLVHGILHLAGFSHEESAAEAKRMSSWQGKILKGWKG